MSVAIHVQPEVRRERIVRNGIVSVPGEMATLCCTHTATRFMRAGGRECDGCAIEKRLGRPIVPRGIALDDIPLEHRMLQKKLHQVGKMFVERQQVRGLTFIDHEDMHAYGPFPSYEHMENMVDLSQFATRNSSDPREAKQLVKDRATSIEAYADYLLVGAFIAPQVQTEVWTPERRLGGSHVNHGRPI